MYRIVVLVLCYHVLSQPVTDVTSTRHARELIECCPCPGAGARDGQDWLADGGQLLRMGAGDGQDWLADGGQLARAGALEDCPCRARDADSEGASSLFFPAALRPDGSQLRSTDPKEDPKNLLEPEVALATSVLDTLREATDEQYREALEREAARNAAELDAVPEESARNVVIVVNPRDSDDDNDFISEASHVQEPRCIHPLESTPLGRMRSPVNPINILPESFQFPKLKHLELPRRNLLQFDSNTDASNVKESIVDPNGNSPKFSSEIHKIPFKSIFENQNNGVRFSKPNFMLGKFNQNKPTDGSLVPNIKPRTNIFEDDLISAPNNMQHPSELATEATGQLLQNDKLPLTIRNLLKLKDVELIPKTIRNKSWVKPKLDLSKFAIPSLLKYNKNKNLPLSTTDKDTEQREVDYANTSDTSASENTNAFQNTRVNSMQELNESFNYLGGDSIFNKNTNNIDENYAIDGKQINSDAFSSPSEIISSIIRPDNEKNLETSDAISLLRSNSECDSSNLKESDILDTQLKEILDEAHEVNSDSPVFENTNVVTDDIFNLNDDTIANDSLQDQDIDVDRDSNTDSSNLIMATLVPKEKPEETVNEPTQSRGNIEVNSEIIEKYETGSNTMPENVAKTIEDIEPQDKDVPYLSETLSSLRENVFRQVADLKAPSIQSELFKTFSDNDNVNVDEGERTINGDTNQITKNSDPANTVDTSGIENVAEISMDDLQNMSDKLLDSNLNIINKHILGSTASSTDEANLKSSEVNDKSDSEVSETKLNPINIEKIMNIEEVACPTNFEAKNANVNDENVTKSATSDTEPKEMDTGASDTVINTLPGILDSLNPNLKLRSPLLSDIVLQPSSDPLNLLGKPLGDVLSLNTNIPTLDDLRERLANIFKTDDGSIENSSSLETDFSNDSPLETMATEASTRKSQKELPLLKQIEDFNHDIIKKKPKKLNPFDGITNSQMLDLNSFRAHLPSPNTLDLKSPKPLKFEPRLRNMAEKNKSPTNFGSGKTVLRKAKPTSTLANPLNSFPTLEELRNTLKSNSRNLLNSPVHSDLLSENLRSHDIEDVAENIRLNTEKTLKGIQRKMKSSLRKPNVHNPFRESLANPHDLLDDMNDKLKGLHYDLNDRLTSLRENMNDFVDQSRKPSNRNVMTNLRNVKTKPSSPRLQTAASTTTNQKIDPKKLGLESRKFVQPDWIMSRKTQTAPARIETPKSANPLFSQLPRKSSPFRQNPIVTETQREKASIPSLNREVMHSKDLKSPLFRTATSPFNTQRQPNKVTISFGTTARPIIPSRPIIRVPNMSTSQFEGFNPSSTSFGTIDAFSTDNTAAMSAVPASKFKPLRASAPMPSPADEDFEDSLNNFSFEELPSTDSKFKSSVLREMSSANIPKLHSYSNKLKSADAFEDDIDNDESKSSLQTLHWPKVTENTLLSKVREAANTRKLDVPKPVKDLKSEQLDMLRSPTENTDIVMDEPLKENVSYRCRMVCTKERR